MNRLPKVGVLVAVAVIALAGCTPRPEPPQGPLALSVQNGRLVLGICTSGQISRIVLSERDRGDGGDWYRIWATAGSTVLPEGSTVEVGTDPPGLASTYLRTPTVDEGYQFDVTVVRTSDPAVYLSAVFDPIPAGLDDGLWLQPNGDVGGAMCPER